MTKQIALRLPEELVAFVDERVADGTARSRASVVAGALERERRRSVAERDAAILARRGADPGLTALAASAARTPLDLD